MFINITKLSYIQSVNYYYTLQYVCNIINNTEVNEWSYHHNNLDESLKIQSRNYPPYNLWTFKFSRKTFPMKVRRTKFKKRDTALNNNNNNVRTCVTNLIHLSLLFKNTSYCNLMAKVILSILNISYTMPIHSSTVGLSGFNHFFVMVFLQAVVRI